MSLRYVIFMAFLCLVPSGEAAGQPAPAAIERVFAPLGPDTPGLSVLVARGGKVIFQRSAGAADIEQRTAVTARTRFHVASVSKQFTAAAILILAREGRVELDAPARKYLPSLPAAYSSVTVRQLLNHTGGLRDQWELAIASGASTADVLTQQRLLALIQRQTSLNFAPGSEFRYSNSGYLIAAEIVARVSGMPFARFIDTRLFRPLGMRDTLVYDDATMPIPGRAQSYAKDRQGRIRLSRLNFSNYGATSIFTTPGDLYLWSRELLHPKVLDPSIVREMAQRTRLGDGTFSPYGLGLNNLTVLGHDAVMHSGSDAGFRALFAMYPRNDATIIVLSNGSDDMTDLQEKLVGAFLGNGPGVDRAVPPSAAQLAPLTGYYASSWGPGFELRLVQGKLVRAAMDDETQDAVFHTDGTIRFADPALRLTFAGPGQVHDNPIIGPSLTYTRVHRATPTPAAMSEAVGRYRSDELDNTVSVTLENGRLYMSSQRSPGLKPLAPADAGAFDMPGARVTFEPGRDGRTNALLMTMNRSRNIRFVRMP